MTTNYSIDTGDGNELCAGLPEQTAYRTAQKIADERGESVYLYSSSCSGVQIVPSSIDVKLDTPMGPIVEYGGHTIEAIEDAIPEGYSVDWSSQIVTSVTGTHTLRHRAPLVRVPDGDESAPRAPITARVVVTRASSRPSRKVDDAGARDATLVLTIVTPINHVTREISTTLIPDHTGALESWGELDNWLDSRGCAIVELVISRHVRALVETIRDAAAHGGPETCEIEVRSS